MASARLATAAVAVLAAVVLVAAWSAHSGPAGSERFAARAADTPELPGTLAWQYDATGRDRVPAQVLHSGAAVRVAVIDTGSDVSSAPGLVTKQPAAYNVRTRSSDISDENGHGTFVTSLVAGPGDHGAEVAAGGDDVQLLVVKAADANGTFTPTAEADAIRYATDHGARIINLSFVGTTTSKSERRAIAYAVDRGVLLVAAAGNEYGNGNPVEYPAALLQPPGSNGADGAGLVVAASTRDGSHAPFSNTGSWISLAAPGVGVFGAVSAHSSPSTYPRTALPGSSGLFGYASGTSFAAPQVAGAAALVWGVNPSLTAREVARILKETATGHGTWTPELGFGVIDVPSAVARAAALR